MIPDGFSLSHKIDVYKANEVKTLAEGNLRKGKYESRGMQPNGVN